MSFRPSLAVFSLFTFLAAAGMAQSAPPRLPAPTTHKPAALSQAQITKSQEAELEHEAEALKQSLEKAGDEPGAQLRALTAFLRKYPHPPAEDQILKLMIQDATKLNREGLALTLDERLQRLTPGDLGQRIRTLNLLLLNRDAASRKRALRYAAQLRQLVKVKAAQPAPAELGPVRWQRDMNRLRALADLLAGTASRHLRLYPAAARQLESSLHLEPTEEAAEQLGRIEQAEQQPAAAVKSYALALALPGQTIAERYALRGKAGALYRQLHGSERGFGDQILAQFDRVAQQQAARQSARRRTAAIVAAPRRLSQISFASLDGRRHRLADYRGKVVVLDLWATWCGPCRVEHPLLEQLKRSFAASPRVAFIMINADSDRSRIPGFVRREGWGGHSWLDAGLMRLLGIRGLPATLVLSSRGRLVFRESGLNPSTFKHELRRAILSALRRPAAAVGKRG